jgi:hypothetical protein
MPNPGKSGAKLYIRWEMIAIIAIIETTLTPIF